MIAHPGNEQSLKKPLTSPFTLLVDTLGAFAWGVFLSLAPIVEIIILGSIVWIPLLVWRERQRSLRHNFLPGFALRVVVAGCVIAIAAALPMKYEDTTRLGPLSNRTLPLAVLAAELEPHVVSIELRGLEDKGTAITLSSTAPTVRELIRAVESKTSLRYVPRKCGNAATVLWGSYPIGSVDLLPTSAR